MQIPNEPIASPAEFFLPHPDTAPIPELTDDEKIDIAARRILERFRPAFEELAK